MGMAASDQPGYAGDPCFEDARTPIPVWPQPVPDTPSVIDDVWHATINGRGVYFNAYQPDTLADALSDIISQVDGIRMSASSVTLAGPMTQGPAMIYQTRYCPKQWTGDLLALQVDFSGDQNIIDPDVIIWSAADQLSRPGINADSRRIITYGGFWRRPQGIPFRYNEFSAEQKTALGSDLIDGSAADRQARLLVDYLRGREIATFRSRNSILGDMVHAAPVWVGDTVFVGANEGMLHAFDAHTGDERFAYIPHLVFRQLKKLAEPSYHRQHLFFVDATPSVGEVMVEEYHRRRYLVGGLGKGGRGYYCLRIGESQRRLADDASAVYESSFNVDDLDSSATEHQIADIVQWEYPRPDPADDNMDNDSDGFVDEAAEQDPDMGYSFGQGYAVNANVSPDGYRPVVIFGNGYDSERGHAVLVILDAGSGTLIRKIDTGAGDDNGLSIPALIDVNLDRRVDYAYAGDLNGNLWKFDLTSADPMEWGVAYGEDIDANARIDAADGDQPRPLFHASGQPITGRPDIMSARSICAADAPGYLVIFGTGRYLGLSDCRDASQQSIYALWDYGDDSDDSEYLGSIMDRTEGRLSNGLRLIRQEINTISTMDGSLVRELSHHIVDFRVTDDTEDGDRLNANNHGLVSPDPLVAAGWFFDFPASTDSSVGSGERVVGNTVIRGGHALITSFVPDNSPCSSGGASWIYLLSGCSAESLSENASPLSFLTPMTARRYQGRLNINPLVVKEASVLALDQTISSDENGLIFKLPLMGEQWGKIFWRQNPD